MLKIAQTLPAIALLATGVGCRKAEVHAADDPLTLEHGLFYAGAGMNDRHITLAPGDVLRVELESVPTAGYEWIVTDKPDFLSLGEESIRPSDPEAVAEGQTGGWHFLSFDFTATASGSGKLRLVEGRPWELDAGTEPDDTFELNVTVSE